MMFVKPERQGWRDEALSRRHRAWGTHAPMTDLDFVVVEYANRKPAALIEYKHENGFLVCAGNANMDVLIDLGTNHTPPLPVFVVRYTDALNEFEVRSMNRWARAWLDDDVCSLNEMQYVELLYAMRRYEMPAVIRDEIEQRTKGHTNNDHFL